MSQKNITAKLLLIVAIVVIVNIIAIKLIFRIDFTADKTYTLSNATKNILKNLEEPVTINAYISSDLPVVLKKSTTAFKEQLIEYNHWSGGKVVFEFVDPSESEEKERDAQTAGIQPRLVNVREKDQVKQQKVYLGAVIQIGNKSELLPIVQPNTPIEFALTTAIKKLSVLDKPKLAFIEGHGEATKDGCSALVQELSILYNVSSYAINDTSEIPLENKVILIMNPQDTVPASHIQKIDNYFNGGGKIFITLSKVKGDLNNASLQAGKYTGIEDWLTSKGITVEENFVRDVKCGQISVRQPNFPFPVSMRFHYFPLITTFPEHPITKGLESLFFPFASSITFSPIDTTWTILPIVLSSEQSGIESPPSYVDISKQWTEADFPLSTLPLAVIAEKRQGDNKSRLVVISNGEMAMGEANPRSPMAANFQFAANAIDWLHDDTGLNELRTKQVTSRPLKQLEEGTKDIIKWGNVGAPIVLVLLYSFFRNHSRNRKRQRWMQDQY